MRASLSPFVCKRVEFMIRLRVDGISIRVQPGWFSTDRMANDCCSDTHLRSHSADSDHWNLRIRKARLCVMLVPPRSEKSSSPCCECPRAQNSTYYWHMPTFVENLKDMWRGNGYLRNYSLTRSLTPGMGWKDTMLSKVTVHERYRFFFFFFRKEIPECLSVPTKMPWIPRPFLCSCAWWVQVGELIGWDQVLSFFANLLKRKETSKWQRSGGFCA